MYTIISVALANSQKFTQDSLSAFKHIWEVGVSFAENTGQRLDIAKFSRIIGETNMRKREVREKGRGSEREIE